jgi:acetyl esterase/lipase
MKGHVTVLPASAGNHERLRRRPVTRAALGAFVLASAMLLAATYPGGDQTAAAAIHADAAKSAAAQPTSALAAVSAASAEATTATPAPLPAASDRIAELPASAVYQPAGFKVVGNVPFTQLVECANGQSCQVQADIYVPTGPGTYPVVVLAGPGGRGYLASFAGNLARLGILVFNVDFRDVAGAGGGYPQGFQDVACAVRFARAQASGYGGDADTITLVGHSLGGWVGSVVALDQIEFQGGCLTGGSGRPDAFVGLSGSYQISGGENESDLRNFFGGSAATTAQARTAADPFNYANGSAIPIRLVAGTADQSVDPAQSIALNAFLLKQGWDVALTMVPAGSHMSIVSDQATYDAVFSAMAAAESIGS